MAGPMLEILTGDLSGRCYRVEESEFVIGRAPSCDLVLPKRYISREHARISRAGRDFVIDGLSEKNPVLVEDRPIRSKHRLRDGEEFELCGIRIRFHAQGDVAPRRGSTAMTSRSGQVGGGHQSSWASDPDYPARGGGGTPTPDPDAGGRGRDLREASAPPRGLASLVDDDTGPPTSRSLPSDDDLPVPARGSGAIKRSGVAASGKVVFEAEGDGDDEDATRELPSVGKGQKGAASGSKESQNERTAELGKVQNPDDPDYDPFAEVDRRETKKKGTDDPGREKALRLLMVVGAFGIVLAGAILWKLWQPKPVQYVDHPTPIKVALDQVVRFEEPWSQVDPPWGRKATRRDGEPYIYYKDNVVEVEWAVPHIKTKCVFLVRGLENGETTFEVQFPESRRVKRFTVICEGDNPHDVARERRRAELRKLPAPRLRELAEQALASGETYTKERDVTAREGYYRLAASELARAADAAVILRDVLATGGIVPPDVAELVRKAEDAEVKARNDYEDFVNREIARYRAALQREARLESIEQLQRCLRAINHDCDPRFQRLRLILEESWGVPWAGDGTEVCGDRS